MQKSLDQQIAEAIERARTSTISVLHSDERTITVTSGTPGHEPYVVSRDTDGNLSCSCPAQVVCKHVGLLLLSGEEYHVDIMAAAQQARLEAFKDVAVWLDCLPATPAHQPLVKRLVASVVGLFMAAGGGKARAAAKEAQWQSYQSARLGGLL